METFLVYLGMFAAIVFAVICVLQEDKNEMKRRFGGPKAP